MSQPERSPLHHIAFLDLLRSLAIALVMLHHYRNLPGTPDAIRWFALRGYVGVDIFFVLSGWLIGGQLFREMARTGKLRVGRFWARRWLRTLPLYDAVLLGMAYLNPQVRAHFVDMLFFVQNYTAPQAWLVTWSLCIEEHFYLGLPLLILLLAWISRGRVGWIVALACGAIAVSPVLRYGLYLGGTDMPWQAFLNAFYVPTHLRLDGLLMGVGLAALATWEHPLWGWMTRRPFWLLGLGTVLLVSAIWLPWLSGWSTRGTDRMAFYNVVPQYFLVSLAVAALIAGGVALHERGLTLRVPGTGWMAEHAYALYLVHQQVMHWTQPRLSWPGSFVVTCLLALATASLVRQLFEKPGLWLRRRWMDREKTPPAKVVTA